MPVDRQLGRIGELLLASGNIVERHDSTAGTSNAYGATRMHNAGSGRVLVRMLGPLDVTSDRGTVALRNRTGQLVALLALERSRALSKAEILERLWQSSTPTDSVRSSFRTYLAKARQALGVEHVVASNGTYRLDPRRVDVDVDLAERDLAVARSLVRTDPVAAAAAFGRVLAWWRGDALDGFRDVECFAEDVRLLDEHRELVFEEWLSARLDAGETSGVVSELRRAVADRPWSERRAMLLMRALARSGNRVEALRAYQQLYTYLTDEVGVLPGPEVVALEQSILLETATSAPAASSIPAVVGTAAVDFVGRASLVRALDDDRLRVVVVVGESGSGKTALAGHVAERVHARGDAVAYGAAYPDEPLASFRWLTPDGGVPNGGVPNGSAPDGAGRVDAGQLDADAHVIAERVLVWASTSATRRAVVLLDDFQWADATTRAVVALLQATHDERRPLLRILTRPHAPLPASGARLLTMPPFERADVDALLHARTGEWPDPSTVALVHGMSGGLAIYAAALADHVATYGGRPDDMLCAARALSPILDLRFAALGPDDRVVLGALALCRGAGASQLADVLDLPLDRVRTTLRRAADAGLVVSASDPMFRHELLVYRARDLVAVDDADAIVARWAEHPSLQPWEKVRVLVERPAAETPRHGPASFAALATAACACADDAFAAGAAGDMAVVLEALCRHPGMATLTDAQRVHAYDLASRAHDLSGDPLRGRARRVDAFELALASGLHETAIGLVVRGAANGRSVVSAAEDRSLLRRAMAMVDATTPDPLAVRLRAERLFQSLLAVNPDVLDARAAPDDARRLSQSLTRTQDPLTRAMAHRALYLAASVGISGTSPRAHVRAMTSATRRLTDEEVKRSALEYRLRHVIGAGRTPVADRVLDQVSTFAVANGGPGALWSREVSTACVAELRGRLDIADHHARSAYARGVQFGVQDAELAWALHLTTQRLHSIVSLSPVERSVVLASGPHAQLLVAALEGTLDPASPLLDDLIRHACGVGPAFALPFLVGLLTEVLWRVDGHGRGAGLLELVPSPVLDGRFVVVGHVPVTTLGPTARVRGLLLALQGRLHEADGELREAARHATLAGSPLWLAAVLDDHARVLDGLGLRAEAASARARATVARTAIVVPNVRASPFPDGLATMTVVTRRNELRAGGQPT